MAIYKRMSVAAGGGVIDNLYKAQMADALNICIGLGGTGADMIKALKKEVYSHIRPDDESTAIPHYNNIQFLVIDGDDSNYFSGDKNIWDIDIETEYFDVLSRNKVPHCIRNFRQLVRSRLIDKAGDLKEKLTSMLQLGKSINEEEIYVHIFSGVCGGTGGAIFSDVGYIVQEMWKNVGLKGFLNIRGYIFLPDVNLNHFKIEKAQFDHMCAIGYATLKELDYLMKLEENGGRFKQDYGTFCVDTNSSPVTICYLLSSISIDGVKNSYDQVLRIAINYVMQHFLIKGCIYFPFETEVCNNTDTFKIIGCWTGLRKAMRGPYCAIGEVHNSLSYSDIATYLGAKLFERFGFMYNQVPTENQLMEFVTENQLGYEQILSALTKGIAFHVPFPKYDPKDLIASNKQPIDRCDDWIAGARGKLQENRKNMEEKLRDYKIPENSTSLIARIYLDLYTNYACDAKYGPFFAMRMLGGMNNKNMFHIIDGYVQKNDSLMAAEVRQDKLREDDLKNAEAQLKNARTGLLGNAKKRSQEYLWALNNWYVHRASIEKYKYMQSFLCVFREQIVNLNNSFFDVLTTVLDTIKNTFEDNAKFLTEDARSTENTYGWKILDIPDIQEQLDAVVEKLDVDQVKKKFVWTMFNRYTEWLDQDPNKITMLISEFITEQFSAITQQTIKDFLQIKYATTDPVILQKNIKDDIIEKRLDAEANPLFWKNSSICRGSMIERKTIFAPYYTPEICGAVEDFGYSNGISVQKSKFVDRISMTTLYIGLPLWGYGGIEELKNAYQQYRKSGLWGLHLYEREDLDWGKTLPDIAMRPQGEENGYFY